MSGRETVHDKNEDKEVFGGIKADSAGNEERPGEDSARREMKKDLERRVVRREMRFPLKFRLLLRRKEVESPRLKAQKHQWK